MNKNWLKQSKENPLFPDVIWSRPETKNGSGKLLIIGGSVGNFAKTARSFSEAEKAGIGTIHLLVPDSLQKITKEIPFIQYAPSNPSGGFAKNALSEILELAKNVDGIYIAGDLGKNSETTLMFENFAQTKKTVTTIISSEALESFESNKKMLLQRENTIICLNQSQLRVLGTELHLEQAMTSGLPKSLLARSLYQISKEALAGLIIELPESIWICLNGSIAECEKDNYSSVKSAVWLLQQPEKAFEALVCSTL